MFGAGLNILDIVSGNLGYVKHSSQDFTQGIFKPHCVRGPGLFLLLKTKQIKPAEQWCACVQISRHPFFSSSWSLKSALSFSKSALLLFYLLTAVCDTAGTFYDF